MEDQLRFPDRYPCPGKRRSRFIQSLSLILIALVFITIIIIVAVVYQKYRQVKRKVSALKKNLLNIIPKMRVHRYNKIRYPGNCPSLLSTSLDPLPRTKGSSRPRIGGSPTHFNTDIARLLEKFIKSAYNLSAGFEHALPRYVELVTRLGETGYVFRLTPDEQSDITAYSYIIAYRGTNSREDILTDIDFSQTALNGNGFVSDSENGVLCHSGFIRLWKEQKAELNKAAEAFTPGCKVYITGHSLGAAMAAFTALDLSHVLPKSCKFAAYLFAPPRVGNERFIEMLYRHVPHCWAIINKRDIVPNLPPPVFSLFGARWIYDDYQKICTVDIETGSIIENHGLDVYISGLFGDTKPLATGTQIYWNRKAKIPKTSRESQ
jgi:triacylglycerol lipase